MTIGKASTAELLAEIKRREKGADKLRKRRDKILAELATIEAELSELGLLDGPKGGRGGRRGRPAGSGGKRPKNSLSLPDALAACAEVGAVLSPAEAATLVKANGYKTVSKSFGAQVANALAKHDKFKKEGRGQYKRVK